MVPITTAAFRRNLHQQRHIAHRAAASIRALGSRMIANSGYLQRIGFDSTQKAYFAEEHAGATEFRDAKVLGIVRTFQDADGTGSSSPAVVLDKTIFHPQGGGQPSDGGFIETEDGRAQFEVMMCRSDAKTGVITHGGKWITGSEADMPPGTSVVLRIDEEKRQLHTKIHSAGHAIDVAVAKLAAAGNEHAGGLTPTKGYHFPDAPSVEYDGKVPADAAEAMVSELQKIIEDLISEDISTVVKEILGSEVDPTYSSTGFPRDERVRVVGVAGNLLCPCGGTHVSSSSQLRGVKITRVKSKKGATKVSYIME